MAGFIGTFAIVIALSLLLGQKAIVIGSDSMKPALESGDLVFERQRSPIYANPGEIISFSEPGTGRTLTRRLVTSAPEGQLVRLIAKADDASTVDNITVSKDGAIGFPVRSVPWAGGAVEALERHAALLIIPGLIILMAASYELGRRRGERIAPGDALG